MSRPISNPYGGGLALFNQMAQMQPLQSIGKNLQSLGQNLNAQGLQGLMQQNPGQFTPDMNALALTSGKNAQDFYGKQQTLDSYAKNRMLNQDKFNFDQEKYYKNLADEAVAKDEMHKANLFLADMPMPQPYTTTADGITRPNPSYLNQMKMYQQGQAAKNYLGELMPRRSGIKSLVNQPKRKSVGVKALANNIESNDTRSIPQANKPVFISKDLPGMENIQYFDGDSGQFQYKGENIPFRGTGDTLESRKPQNPTDYMRLKNQADAWGLDMESALTLGKVAKATMQGKPTMINGVEYDPTQGENYDPALLTPTNVNLTGKEDKYGRLFADPTNAQGQSIAALMKDMQLSGDYKRGDMSINAFNKHINKDGIQLPYAGERVQEALFKGQLPATSADVDFRANLEDALTRENDPLNRMDMLDAIQQMKKKGIKKGVGRKGRALEALMDRANYNVQPVPALQSKNISKKADYLKQIKSINDFMNTRKTEKLSIDDEVAKRKKAFEIARRYDVSQGNPNRGTNQAKYNQAKKDYEDALKAQNILQRDITEMQTKRSELDKEYDLFKKSSKENMLDKTAIHDSGLDEGKGAYGMDRDVISTYSDIDFLTKVLDKLNDTKFVSSANKLGRVNIYGSDVPMYGRSVADIRRQILKPLFVADKSKSANAGWKEAQKIIDSYKGTNQEEAMEKLFTSLYGKMGGGSNNKSLGFLDWAKQIVR